jgi:sugar fermentation stimulation protein A
MTLITAIGIDGDKEKAIFIKRLNRFEALVDLGGETTLCHVANTGRMKELLVPGRDVIIRRAANIERKTKWDLIIAHTAEGVPVLLESVMANRLVLKAIAERKLNEFEGYTEIKRESSFGNSRFDIRLTEDKSQCFIEVKCVTLVDGDIAKFPDAPTERGRKHVLELVRAKAEGHRAAVIAVAQREDAKSFRPNWEMDPGFSKVLADAAETGVEVYAYNCLVLQDEIALLGRINTNLSKNCR